MRRYKELKQEYDKLNEKYINMLGEKSEIAYELDDLKASAEQIRGQDMQIRHLHENIRHLKHDMKNHLMVIADYLNDGNFDSAKHYTSEILDKLNSVHSYIETGNSLLNHIVNEKLECARTRGICIKAEIENLSFSRMGSLDFSSLLTNLLDNAIEACEVEDAPEIFLNITKRRGYHAVIVKNKISHSVLKQNPDLKTSKREKGEHGLGVPQIKAISKKYNGISDFYEEEGFFCACSFIPE